MYSLTDAMWIEFRKAFRSRIPLFTALGFLMLPLSATFFMIILKDPVVAKEMGLISAKAHLVGETADWPTYLSIYSQGIAIAGIMLFSIINSWLFGREFADGTVKDLLAVPVPRLTILLAKFIVGTIWSASLCVMVYVIGLVLGAWIGLPDGSMDLLVQGSITFSVTALLVMVVMTPIPFFASIGRGYLFPMGMALLLLLLANLIVVLGWGHYFPWSVPALYSGGTPALDLVPASYLISALTGLAGIAGTYLWWRFADQSH